MRERALLVKTKAALSCHAALSSFRTYCVSFVDAPAHIDGFYDQEYVISPQYGKKPGKHRLTEKAVDLPLYFQTPVIT